MRWNEVFNESTIRGIKVFHDFRRFMGGIIVRNNVQRLPLRALAIHHFQEGNVVGGLVPILAVADDLAACHIQRREQRRRSMAIVIMGLPFRYSRKHRKDGL